MYAKEKSNKQTVGESTLPRIDGTKAIDQFITVINKPNKHFTYKREP